MVKRSLLAGPAFLAVFRTTFAVLTVLARTARVGTDAGCCPKVGRKSDWQGEKECNHQNP